MKKSILEYLERLLEAALSALASLGMFLFVTFLINLFWDGTLTTKDMMAVFMASLFVVYYMTHALVMVRYERLEILADELENQEAKELYEHLEVK